MTEHHTPQQVLANGREVAAQRYVNAASDVAALGLYKFIKVEPI